MMCILKKEHCIACGLCQIIVPTFFDYTENGIVIFKNESTDITHKEIDISIQTDCINAAKECPTHAIKIEK